MTEGVNGGRGCRTRLRQCCVLVLRPKRPGGSPRAAALPCAPFLYLDMRGKGKGDVYLRAPPLSFSPSFGAWAGDRMEHQPLMGWCALPLLAHKAYKPTGVARNPFR